MDARNINSIVRLGPFTKFMAWVCGVNELTLRQCPKKDHDNIRALGLLLVGSFIWQSTIVGVVSLKLFAAPGDIRPDLIVGSLFVCALIMAVDSYVFFRSGFEIAGIEGLRRGGLDVGGGPGPIAKLGYLGVRLMLSFGIAQLLAIFGGLIIFSSDVDDRVRIVQQKADAHLVAEATLVVQDQITRATDAVQVEGVRVDKFSKQISMLRQNDIEIGANDPQIQQAQEEVNQLFAQSAKAAEAALDADNSAAKERGGFRLPGYSGVAGNGPRYKAALEAAENARKHAQEISGALEAARARLTGLRKELVSSNEAEKQRSHSELPGYEATLAAEEAKLAGLKQQLDGLVSGRAESIRTAVERAPDYVPLNRGVLAQLRAIEVLSSEDGMIATVIFLIDLVAMGLDLAGVLAKVTSFVPMTYSDLIARDAFMTDVRFADDIVAELDASRSKEANDNIKPPMMPANDNKHDLGSIFGIGDLNNPSVPTPPKRPRGRPRKYPRDDT